eukprot:2933752-Prymnesium_polylepis.1
MLVAPALHRHLHHEELDRRAVLRPWNAHHHQLPAARSVCSIGVHRACRASDRHTQRAQREQGKDDDEPPKRCHVETALDRPEALRVVNVNNVEIGPVEHAQPTVPLPRHGDAVDDGDAQDVLIEDDCNLWVGRNGECAHSEGARAQQNRHTAGTAECTAGAQPIQRRCSDGLE